MKDKRVLKIVIVMLILVLVLFAVYNISKEIVFNSQKTKNILKDEITVGTEGVEATISVSSGKFRTLQELRDYWRSIREEKVEDVESASIEKAIDLLSVSDSPFKDLIGEEYQIFRVDRSYVVRLTLKDSTYLDVYCSEITGIPCGFIKNSFSEEEKDFLNIYGNGLDREIVLEDGRHAIR